MAVSVGLLVIIFSFLVTIVGATVAVSPVVAFSIDAVVGVGIVGVGVVVRAAIVTLRSLITPSIIPLLAVIVAVVAVVAVVTVVAIALVTLIGGGVGRG